MKSLKNIFGDFGAKVICLIAFLVGWTIPIKINEYYKMHKFYKHQFEVNEKKLLLNRTKIDSLENKLQKCDSTKINS